MLSLLIFLPALFAILLWFLPEGKAYRPIALVFATVEFLLSLVMLRQFDPSTPTLQMVEKISWIPQFGINYFIGIDGISLWLVMLTTFLTPVVIMASWTGISEKVRPFHVTLFFLQTATLGTFLAIDSILFYVFFEASLVPMYFMVGVWGGARRIYATLKFFIYTMVGSLMMLLAIIYMMLMTKETLGMMSASLLDFYKLQIPFVAGEFLNPQTLMFAAFSLAFAIKVPMFPVHTWLPDAHVEAPTPGSVVLAAVMLKMGTYGFLRFVIPLFPEASAYWAWLFMGLAVIGIIYGALVAMVQPDIKKLVAYSSVSHMGYVVLGLFALNLYGTTGALYQMLNHGVSTGALFILVGMIYERTHSRNIADYGGLASAMPIFAIFFIIVTMSSIAVPMTNGFVGEFLILMGGFEADHRMGYLAVLGVVLGAVYMLWMVKRVFFGAPGPLVPAVADNHHGHDAQGHDSHGGHAAQSAGHGAHDHGGHAHPLLDLNWREVATLMPLVILVFWMGLFPNHFLKYSEASLNHLINNKSNYQLNVQNSGIEANDVVESVAARTQGSNL
jgi:NADH-quinone oxidoreductase subunit M